MRTKLFLILLMVSLTAAFLYAHRPFSFRMSAFVTDLEARSPEQRLNIERAGQLLSGTILKSGELLSLNEKTGPFTEARGFLPERTYVERKTVDLSGGGVCQLASTLYNAGLKAGLQIT